MVQGDKTSEYYFGPRQTKASVKAFDNRKCYSYLLGQYYTAKSEDIEKVLTANCRKYSIEYVCWDWTSDKLCELIEKTQK